MDPTLVAGLGAGVDMVGGLLSNAGAAHQAHLNRRFVKNMSNTAHQREVADLRAAGLNPALAYGMGGSSTPGGSAAPQENVGAAAVSGATSAASTALSSVAQKVAIVKMGADTRKTLAEADWLEKTSEDRMTLLGLKGNLLGAQTGAAMAQGALSGVQHRFLDSTMEERKAQVHEALRGQQISNKLSSLQIAGASAKSAADSTWFGRFIMPYIATALGLFRTLAPGGLPMGVPSIPVPEKGRIGFQ